MNAHTNPPPRPEAVAALRNYMNASAATLAPDFLRWTVARPAPRGEYAASEFAEAARLSLSDRTLPLQEPAPPLAELHQRFDELVSVGFKPVAVVGAYANVEKAGKRARRDEFTVGDVAAERAALVEGDNIGCLGGTPVGNTLGHVLAFGDADFDDADAYGVIIKVPSLAGRPERDTGKVGRGVIPFPVPEGTPYKTLDWKRESDGRIIRMELRATSGQQTIVHGVNPDTKLAMRWRNWTDPNTWAPADPFVMWQEMCAALAPLGWKPTKQFTADDFKPRAATASEPGTTGQEAGADVYLDGAIEVRDGKLFVDGVEVTQAEAHHLDRRFRDLVLSRVTVEKCREVPQGQGGDWFRDHFLPGQLLGHMAGWGYEGWVDFAADIATKAGNRDVERARVCVRDALTKMDIHSNSIGLAWLRAFRQRFGRDSVVSDADAIAIVNAAPPEVLKMALDYARGRVSAFLQESSSDYWFVRLHEDPRRPNGREPISGHEYLAEVARPLTVLVRAGKLDGESIVRLCVAYAAERQKQAVEEKGESGLRAWRTDLAESAVRSVLYHEPVTTAPYTTKAGRTDSASFPAGDYVLTVLQAMAGTAAAGHLTGAAGTAGQADWSQASAPGGAFEVKAPGEDSWPTLLPLDIAATAVPPPKETWVPPAYRQWLSDIAYRKSCPYDFVLATFIVMVGSLIGARLGVKPMNDDDDWLEVPNLWGLIVSRSGTLKSPAISDVLAPVRECAKEFMKQFNEEMRKYEAEIEVHKTAVGGLKRSVAAQFKDGAPVAVTPVAAPPAGAPWSAAEPDAADRTSELTKALMNEPTKPTLRRIIVGSVGSSVRLLRILTEERYGVLMFRDEMVAALYTWSTANDPEQRELMLTSWDGKSPAHYESETQGILHADRGCLALFGGGQPKALIQFMEKSRAAGDGHDGFLQRNGVLVFPVPKKWVRPTRKIETAARDRAHAAIKAIVHLDFNAIGARPGAGSDGIPWVPLSAAARKLFDAWLDSQAEREFEGDEIEAHLSKHRKLVPALALIYEVADFVARRALAVFPQVGPVAIGEVGDEAMRVAIETSDYLADHARKLYSAGSVRMGAAEKLAEAILAGRPIDGMTIAGIVRARWKGLADDTEVAQAVDVLADLGWLRLQPVKRASGGPRTFKIELRPNVATEGKIVQPEAAGAASAKELGANT
ncbi:DUF3987 domain-containing protein [Bradyrhizobium guangdongense]